MTDRPSFLLDCDPGIDDAFAIFLATRQAAVAAVTTVSGNVSIEHTTRNAAHVLELAQVDVPVHRGAAEPLEVAPSFADKIHGRSGLGYLETPESTRPIEQTSAVDAILHHARSGDATIVATGPLTNLALAVRRDPSIVERIRHVYWMGGSTTVGNVTEAAEFNSWVDPHAADAVFRSGLSITMFGLNLTHQVRMAAPHIDALERSGTTTGVQAADFLRFYEAHGHNDGRGQPMHDPCAVLGVTHPELFEWSERHIVVDTDDDRGRTRVHAETGPNPIRIAERIDADAAIELILAAAIEPGVGP